MQPCHTNQPRRSHVHSSPREHLQAQHHYICPHSSGAPMKLSACGCTTFCCIYLNWKKASVCFGLARMSNLHCHRQPATACRALEISLFTEGRPHKAFQHMSTRTHCCWRTTMIPTIPPPTLRAVAFCLYSKTV
jgi:hypothetical protein